MQQLRELWVIPEFREYKTKDTDRMNLGFSKGTLHYMKQNAKNDKLFTLDAHVRERLEMWEGL